MDPSEVIRDRTYLDDDDDRAKDPPGESPEDGGMLVCLDLVKHGNSNGGNNGGSGGINSGSGGRLYRNVKWVDPKNVNHTEEVDGHVLRHYERFAKSSCTNQHCNDDIDSHVGSVDPPSDHYFNNTSNTTTTNMNTSTHSHHHQQQQQHHHHHLLITNPRLRIATISSGYKKAAFFVREDLDTRIYFHALEDAIGYMAKRGYAKMPREEEREWKELLGRAHGVVKVGPKKEKQRYRKGKLVLILKKTITDEKDIPSKTTMRRSSKSSPSSNKKKKKKALLLLENGPVSSQDSQTTTTTTTTSSHSEYSQSTTTTTHSQSTDRTSLGKSIRGNYKSYSEKFLAEQEEQKHQCLLAITEGRPLPQTYPSNDDDGDGAGGGMLLLTDGSTKCTTSGSKASTYRSENDDTHAHSSSRDGSRRSGSNATGSGSHSNNSINNNSSTKSYSKAGTTTREDFRKSCATVGSNRKGVYGGGVRYFTPVKYDEEEEEEEESSTEEDDDDEDSEQDQDSTEVIDYKDEEEESQDSNNEEEEEEHTMDIDGSDMGSMFSQEEESYYNGNAGVESVDSSAGSSTTHDQNEIIVPTTTLSSSPRGTKSSKSGGRKEEKKKGKKIATSGNKSKSNRRSRSPPEMAPISDDSASNE